MQRRAARVSAEAKKSGEAVQPQPVALHPENRAADIDEVGIGIA